MRDTWTHHYVSTRRANSVAREYGRQRASITVSAGLHQLGGNQHPYFSVTADIYSPGHRRSPFACGCLHEGVLRMWPKLAPVVELHLCDDNGAPMHAEANAWYALAGYYGGANETYHAGGSKGNYPLPAERLDPEKTWQTTEYREPTREECLERFARHVRIPVEEARRLADAWAPRESYCDELNGLYPWAPVRALMVAWVKEQAERWQQEADAVCKLLDSLIAAKEQKEGE